MTRQRPFLLFSSLLLLLYCGTVERTFANSPGANNLYFGEALYESLVGSSFDSAAKFLRVYEDGEQAAGNGSRVQLHLADIYAGYGFVARAERLYRSVAEYAERIQLRDRAWLGLAKLDYTAGQHGAALKSIREISGSLDNRGRSERDVIQAYALLDQGKIAKAVKSLGKLNEKFLWATYQRFNFAVASLRKHRTKHGALLLRELGQLKGTDEELLAIRDQANLSLGYLLLQMNKPVEARNYLQKVRIDGPMTPMALLGMGWTYSAQESYEQALVYWLELQDFPTVNAYRYESLLAVPYVFGRLQAFEQAVGYYLSALSRLENEVELLKAAIRAVEDNELTALVSVLPSGESDWVEGWRFKRETHYGHFLPLLMESTAFQKVLREYRELLRLGDRLVGLSTTLDPGKRAAVGDEIEGQLEEMRFRRDELVITVRGAANEKSAELKQLALSLLDRYRVQLARYVEQARFGVAQVIDQSASMVAEGS